MASAKGKALLEFGEHIEGIEYIARPGAYAVVLRESNGELSFIAIEGPGGFYLPGGGIERAESSEDALHREVLEEIGVDVSIGRFIGRAEDYLQAPQEQVYFNMIGIFYLATINEYCNWKPPQGVQWLDARDDLSRLAQESHRWAVRSAVASNR